MYVTYVACQQRGVRYIEYVRVLESSAAKRRDIGKLNEPRERALMNGFRFISWNLLTTVVLYFVSECCHGRSEYHYILVI